MKSIEETRNNKGPSDMTDERKNLWAPWRMEYLEGLDSRAFGDCFLCHALKTPDNDADNHVLWRGGRTLVMLNRFPYSSGHVLIAPQEHLADLDALGDDVMLEMMQRARDVQHVLQAAIRAQGFNIGVNLGRCAGAGLPEHIHLHVVPRWGGDVNFMPVLADVKVMPQSLTAMRDVFLQKAHELGIS